MIGQSKLTLTFGGAVWDARQSSAGVAFGGSAALRFLGGALVPLASDFLVGAGISRGSGRTTVHVPVGVGLSLEIPILEIPPQVWVAPRLDLSFTMIDNAPNQNDARFGLSYGIAFAPGRVGFHLGWDHTDGVSRVGLGIDIQ